MDQNPYSPPRNLDLRSANTGWPFLGAMSFWLAIVFCLIGFVSLFSRNSPPGGWLLLGFLLFLAAIFVGDRRLRVPSLIGLAVCLVLLVGTVISFHYRLQQSIQQRQRLQEMRDRGIPPSSRR